MQNRVIPWISTAVLAIVLVAVVLILLPKSSSAQPSTDSQKRITVVGHGEVNVTPDIARVTIGVQTQGATASEALQSNNTQMQQLIDALKAAGIPATDIQTVGFGVNPRYDYSDDGKGTIVGYDVSNAVNVKIPLNDTGSLLDKVVQLGANNISGIAFDVADKSKALEDARAAAINDAKVRATQYAQASGASVGSVLVITEQIGSSPVPMMERAALPMAADSAVPVEPGQQTQSIDIQVTFALK